MIAYRAMLDVPRELAQYVSRLLHVERRLRGTRKNSRALTCFRQAVLGLRWFRQDVDVTALAREHGISRATGYRYLDEIIDVRHDGWCGWWFGLPVAEVGSADLVVPVDQVVTVLGRDHGTRRWRGASTPRPAAGRPVGDLWDRHPSTRPAAGVVDSSPGGPGPPRTGHVTIRAFGWFEVVVDGRLAPAWQSRNARDHRGCDGRRKVRGCSDGLR